MTSNLLINTHHNIITHYSHIFYKLLVESRSLQLLGTQYYTHTICLVLHETIAKPLAHDLTNCTVPKTITAAGNQGEHLIEHLQHTKTHRHTDKEQLADTIHYLQQ